MLFGVNPLMFSVPSTPRRSRKEKAYRGSRHDTGAGTQQLTEKLGFFEQLLIL